MTIYSTHHAAHLSACCIIPFILPVRFLYYGLKNKNQRNQLNNQLPEISHTLMPEGKNNIREINKKENGKKITLMRKKYQQS